MRCIDVFTQVFHRCIYGTGESIHHDTLNVLGALLYSAGESRKHVRFRKDDFVSKYRTLPLRLKNLELAVPVWCDASGGLRTLLLHCCPFVRWQAFMHDTASRLLCSLFLANLILEGFTLATSMICSLWMGLSNQFSIRNSSVQLVRPR